MTKSAGTAFITFPILPYIVIFIFRAYDQREHYTDIYTTRALVTNTGKVIWNNGALWMSTCKVQAMWFPLDRQVT